MKKHIFSIVLLLVFIKNIEAQSNYYFADNQRQYWRDDSTSINNHSYQYSKLQFDYPKFAITISLKQGYGAIQQ